MGKTNIFKMMFKTLIAAALALDATSAVTLKADDNPFGKAYESVEGGWAWDYGWDEEELGYNPWKVKYHYDSSKFDKPEPEPVVEKKEPEYVTQDVQFKWRRPTGTYQFPGRTDWGEDPDHFNFNKGGLASHNRYRRPLDYRTVIKPFTGTPVKVDE